MKFLAGDADSQDTDSINVVKSKVDGLGVESRPDTHSSSRATEDGAVLDSREAKSASSTRKGCYRLFSKDLPLTNKQSWRCGRKYAGIGLMLCPDCQKKGDAA
jgi:hypothetical protein